MRKFSLLCAIILLAVSLFNLQAFAHPGSLDENNGHYDHSTGEYHYHTGENQGNNPTGDSSSTAKTDSENPPVKPAKPKTIFNHPSAIPFWLLLSIFCFALIEQAEYNNKDIPKGCLSFLLFWIFLIPLIFSASLISIFITGEFDELIAAIAAVVVFNVVYYGSSLCTMKAVLGLGILSILAGIASNYIIYDYTFKISLSSYIIFAIIGYAMLNIYSNTNKQKPQINKIQQSIEQKVKERNTQIAKNKQAPKTANTTHHSDYKYPGHLINTSSNGEQMLTSEDEEQRIASLLEYIDDIEAYHQNYKNNKH